MPGSRFPGLKPLGEAELRRIDRTARRILRRVGLWIRDEQMLAELAEAGVPVDRATGRVTFPDTLLDRALGRAPASFTLCSRDGSRDLTLGTGAVHFGNGGRAFLLYDPRTDTYHPTKLRDVAETALLVEHCEHLDFYIIACQAHDVPAEHVHLNDYYQALCHTRKHVMGGCDDLPGAEQLWRLATAVAGGEASLRERPLVSVITNLISPLVLDENAARVLRFSCRHGLPVTCAPAPTCGATGPATLAGNLAQLHAEALAGVALAQLLAPGCRVLYGAVPAMMDLRRMEYCLGAVETAMMNAAAVALARRYRLPIYASAGVTEAKTPDIQAGLEKTQTLLLAALAGADYVHLAAGMLDSGNTICLPQYLIDNEIIGGARRLLQGLRVDRDTLAYDVVRRVGPGGHYVTEDHTVRHLRTEFFYPELAVRANLDSWTAQGRVSALGRALVEADRLLGGERATGLPETLRATIEARFPEIRPEV